MTLMAWRGNMCYGRSLCISNPQVQDSQHGTTAQWGTRSQITSGSYQLELPQAWSLPGCQSDVLQLARESIKMQAALATDVSTTRFHLAVMNPALCDPTSSPVGSRSVCQTVARCHPLPRGGGVSQGARGVRQHLWQTWAFSAGVSAGCSAELTGRARSPPADLAEFRGEALCLSGSAQVQKEQGHSSALGQ